MTCQDCKAQLFPENPSEPFLARRGKYKGTYLPPLCRYCPGYQEEPVPEVHSIVTPLPGHFEQMRIRVDHLEKQVWRLRAPRKKKVSKYD